MRTTINIKDEVIKQVVEYTGAKNMSQAVNEVLETFVREKRKQKLFELRGIKSRLEILSCSVYRKGCRFLNL